VPVDITTVPARVMRSQLCFSSWPIPSRCSRTTRSIPSLRSTKKRRTTSKTCKGPSTRCPRKTKVRILSRLVFFRVDLSTLTAVATRLILLLANVANTCNTSDAKMTPDKLADRLVPVPVPALALALALASPSSSPGLFVRRGGAARRDHGLICLSFALYLSVFCLSFACHLPYICLSFVCHLSVICLSFVCHLFVICPLFVCPSFVRYLSVFPSVRDRDRFAHNYFQRPRLGTLHSL
jgi:hypothetical protein